MSDDTPSLLNNVSTNHPAHSIALEFFTDESILVIARKYERMAAACPSLYGCRSLSGKLAGVVPPQTAPAEPTRCATPSENTCGLSAKARGTYNGFTASRPV